VLSSFLVLLCTTPIAACITHCTPSVYLSVRPFVPYEVLAQEQKVAWNSFRDTWLAVQFGGRNRHKDQTQNPTQSKMDKRTMLKICKKILLREFPRIKDQGQVAQRSLKCNKLRNWKLREVTEVSGVIYSKAYSFKINTLKADSHNTSQSSCRKIGCWHSSRNWA